MHAVHQSATSYCLNDANNQYNEILTLLCEQNRFTRFLCGERSGEKRPGYALNQISDMREPDWAVKGWRLHTTILLKMLFRGNGNGRLPSAPHPPSTASCIDKP